MRLRIFVLTILVFQFVQMQAQLDPELQNNNPDSLQQLLSQLTGTEKIDTLNSIAYRIVKDFPDSSRLYATRAISLSDSMNYQKGLADGYRIRGISYIMIDSLFTTIINYLNAKNL